MKSRSVSITGATGFVGWHAAETFRDAGWHVRALVRAGSPNVLPDGVERVVAPLERAALADALFASDVVVHSAGLLRAGSAEPFERVNVEGTREVVHAANAAGVRLVHISSQAAIGASPPGRPSDEEDPPHPLTPYGQSKLDAEQVVRREATVPWTILRPASVYGPRDRQFLPLFRLAARGRFLLAARPDARFTLVHVTDVARAIARAADSPPAAGGAFFIGHPQPATTVDVLQAIAGAVGRPYRPTRVPSLAMSILAATGEVAWHIGLTPMFDRARYAEFKAGSFVCAVVRARDRLGFSAAVPLEQGLAATWRWYRDAGWA